MAGERRGFTLIELIAALALSGLLMLGSAGLVDRSEALSDRVVHLSDSALADAGSTDLLFALTSRAEVPDGDLNAFVGDQRSMEFPTWCERVGGWIERCRARFGFAVGSTGEPALTVAFDSAMPMAIATVTAEARFAFLVSGAHGREWFTVWGAGISRPDAVAIISGDTLVLPLGVDR